MLALIPACHGATLLMCPTTSTRVVKPAISFYTRIRGSDDLLRLRTDKGHSAAIAYTNKQYQCDVSFTPSLVLAAPTPVITGFHQADVGCLVNKACGSGFVIFGSQMRSRFPNLRALPQRPQLSCHKLSNRVSAYSASHYTTLPSRP